MGAVGCVDTGCGDGGFGVAGWLLVEAVECVDERGGDFGEWWWSSCVEAKLEDGTMCVTLREHVLVYNVMVNLKGHVE